MFQSIIIFDIVWTQDYNYCVVWKIRQQYIFVFIINLLYGSLLKKILKKGWVQGNVSVLIRDILGYYNVYIHLYNYINFVFIKNEIL